MKQNTKKSIHVDDEDFLLHNKIKPKPFWFLCNIFLLLFDGYNIDERGRTMTTTCVNCKRISLYKKIFQYFVYSIKTNWLHQKGQLKVYHFGCL